ncbi:probable peptidoglycan muropeptide transporter SLC46 [Cydia pomonella]|uniref:probable peptidoglycan muropeptide transporter SLC46 n=1 Tax=Cydia pomonella TaxID=82600 RepID=UPI002ADE4197|nr:probable peptidoglycan muropeptide transporter SLC46 [Cydia pomonella]
MSVNNNETISDNEFETSGTTNAISELPGRPFKITMEVPLFLTLMGIALSGTAINNILLYRTCVHTLNYSKDECKGFLLPDKTNESRKLEEEVQKYATFISMVRTVIEALVPAVLSLFLGVWSDTHGRKPLVVWPLFGLTVTSMLTVVYSMLDDYGPWWFILVVLPFSFTGGFTVLITGAYCYISDITTTDKRSLRMTVVEAAISAGSIVGSVLSSYLLFYVGNVYLLLIVTALYVAAYAFTNVCLIESLTGVIQGGLCSVLDFLLVKEMVTECFKRRPNHGRAKIFLLTLANTLTIFILYGASSLDYLYTREKLHWAMKQYTLFTAANTLIAFLGSILGIYMFQRVLGLGDVPLAIVSFISAVADCLLKTFAVTTWHMYLTSVSFIRVISAPLIRSFLSKMVPLEDIAKVFALLCTMESVCPIIAPLIYNTLYNFTIHDFPGAFYLLSACINAVCVVMLGFVLYYESDSTPYQPLQVSL